MNKKLLIVAGEPSGDQHGAHLLSAMKELEPSLRVWSVGGDRLKAAGSEQIVPLTELSVMGAVEVFKKAARIIKVWKTILRTVDSEKIGTVILIDFPDFNLRLAKALKKKGLMVLYYVSPQVWAWRKGRIKTIRKYVDHIFVLFPFEKDLYEQSGIPVTFVGHPLLDEPFPLKSPEEIAQNFFPEHPAAVFILGLLPGSRESELTRLYPRMLKALDLLLPEFPDLRVIVPQAPGLDDTLFEAFEKEYPWSGDPNRFRRIKGQFREGVKACDLVVLASGTATLETALLGVPMVIVYVMNTLTYLLARALIRVPAIGMVNLIAGRIVMPELIQDNASPSSIRDQVRELLTHSGTLDQMKRELETVRERLGVPGASETIAGYMLEMMGFRRFLTNNPPDLSEFQDKFCL
ncbi:MAG: lipid-A-disaccharide synthase [Leptospirales bacterium]